MATSFSELRPTAIGPGGESSRLTRGNTRPTSRLSVRVSFRSVTSVPGRF